MNFYYLIDFTFFVLIIYFTKIAYERQYYLKIFEYIKIFILLSISAKLAHPSGILLKKLYIFNPDTYFIMILIAFLFNFLFLFYSYKFLLQFLNRFINSVFIKNTFAKFISLFEVVLLFTFLTFFLMQVTFVKKLLTPVINKSFSYKHVKKFYIKFLNKDFVLMLTSTDTQTNYKEILLKSLKSSF